MAVPVILVVDRDPDVGTLMSEVLMEAGYVAIALDMTPHVWTMVSLARPAVVIVDVSVAAPEGWTLIDELHSSPATAGIGLIATSTDHLADSYQILLRPWCQVLPKPFDIEDLVAVVRRAVALAAAPAPARAC